MSIRIAAAALPCTFGILLVVLALMSASSSPTDSDAQVARFGDERLRHALPAGPTFCEGMRR